MIWDVFADDEPIARVAPAKPFNHPHRPDTVTIGLDQQRQQNPRGNGAWPALPTLQLASKPLRSIRATASRIRCTMSAAGRQSIMSPAAGSAAGDPVRERNAPSPSPSRGRPTRNHPAGPASSPARRATRYFCNAKQRFCNRLQIKANSHSSPLTKSGDSDSMVL